MNGSSGLAWLVHIQGLSSALCHMQETRAVWAKWIEVNENKRLGFIAVDCPKAPKGFVLTNCGGSRA
jgi:hypothetical protein